MIPIAKAFFVLFGLYFLALVAMNRHARSAQSLRTLPNSDVLFSGFNVEFYNNISTKDVCPMFHNPSLAYKVLSVLDRFQPVNDTYFYTRKARKNRYTQPHYGL